MSEVRAHIERVFEAERAQGDGGWLSVSVRMVLANMGVVGAEGEARAESVCRFVHRYVEAAPWLLEQIEEAAAEAGVGADVAGVIAAARAYFEAAADFIPDHTGVAGLVDDAYLALRLMERFSAEVHSKGLEVGADSSSGGLMSLPLAAANAAVRSMIGEPIATQLDGTVEGVLAMAAVREAAGRLGAGGVRLDVSNPFEDGIDVPGVLGDGTGANS